MQLPALSQFQMSELQWLKHVVHTMMNNLRQVFEFHKASGRMDKGVALWVLDQMKKTADQMNRSAKEENQGDYTDAIEEMKSAYTILVRAEAFFYVSRTPMFNVESAKKMMDWRYGRYLGQRYTG